MGTKIRKNGQWVDLELNNANSPDRLDGEWLSTVSTSNRVWSNNLTQIFTNNTGKLIYVSVIVRFLSQIGNNGLANANRDIAGGSLWGWVSTPNSTSTSLPFVTSPYTISSGDWTNVCKVRDNGTNNANIMYMNSRFFVPPNCKYGISAHDTGDNNYMSYLGSNLVANLYWNEFELNLAYPDNTFTSLDPNSNNFHRAAKAQSSQITSTWSQFMKDYAVWYEPGNTGTNSSYSTTYTINITKEGDYTLEYGIDGNGNITFDGTQVASAVGTDASWANDPPSSVTIQNVTVGSHTIVATVDGSTNWNSNPAGIAWRLKPFGT